MDEGISYGRYQSFGPGLHFVGEYDSRSDAVGDLIWPKADTGEIAASNLKPHRGNPNRGLPIPDSIHH